MLVKDQSFVRFMDLVLRGVCLVAEGCSDVEISEVLGIDLGMVREFRSFLVKLGFVSVLPRLHVGYDDMLDIGMETREVYVALKHLLLENLHSGDADGNRFRILDSVQRYQSFMLKSQERYHNVKVFREFQRIVLDEVGRFDEGAKVEILRKMRDLISRKF